MTQAPRITYVAKTVKTSSIRRFKQQPREFFDPVEIAARAQSMAAAGQQMPVTVERITGDPKHEYELIDGESRWLSAKKAGIEEMSVLVRSTPFASVTEKHRASLIANFNRSEHTPMEISNALQVQVRAGVLQGELALELGKQPMWVSKYLSLQGLHPNIQRLLDPRVSKKARIAPATAFALAQIPKAQQLEVLETARRSDGKISMDRVKRIIAGRNDIRRTTRKESPARRKAMLENALRALGTGMDKLRRATPEEAKALFAELRKAGEVDGLESVEQMLAMLFNSTGSLTSGIGWSFPDMPVLKKNATDEEIVDHEERLRNYWLAKAGPGNPDRMLLSVAYPPRPMHWTNHKPPAWRKGMR